MKRESKYSRGGGFEAGRALSRPENSSQKGIGADEVLRRSEDSFPESSRKGLDAVEKEDLEHRGIVEMLPILICQLTTDGILEFVNDAYCRYFSKRREQLLGTSFLDLVPRRKREEARRMFSRLSAENSVAVDEYHALLPDGSVRIHRWTGRANLDENNRVVSIYGYGEDITEQRRLEREILEVSDREQSRIGQDLHDTICQDLRGVGFMVEGIAKELRESKQDEVAAKADGIAAFLRETLEETRGTVRGLYPVKVEENGLMSALEELATEVTVRWRIDCRFRRLKPVYFSDNNVSVHVYRIANEAVNNAIKHGNASKIRIELVENGDHRTISVRDNGSGISIRESDFFGKMGLNIMAYRARAIGGVLDVRRGDRNGTVVACTFPRDKEEGQ